MRKKKIKENSIYRVPPVSCWTLCDPWTVAQQALLCMLFSRQEYWSGVLCLPPGDLPNPGIESRSPTLQADSLPSEPPGKPIVRLVAVIWEE